MNRIEAGFGGLPVRRRDLALEVLNEAALALAQVQSLDAMASHVPPLLQRFLSFDRCALVEVLPESRHSWCNSADRPPRSYQVTVLSDSLMSPLLQEVGSGMTALSPVYVPLQNCIAHSAIVERRTVLLEEHLSGSLNPADREDPLVAGGQLRSLLLLPIVGEEAVEGALCFAAVQAGAFSLDDIEFAEDVTLLVAAFLHRWRLANQVAHLEQERDRSGAFAQFHTDTALKGLISSSEFSQSILDNTAAVIFAKDIDSRYLLINKEFENVFGRPAAEVIGSSDFELFPEEIAQQLRKNDLQVLETGQVLRVEELIPKDGGCCSYLSAKFPLLDANGNIFGIGAVATDISQLKQRERELRETNHFLDSVIEHIPNMIFIKEARELRFVRLNRSAEILLGFSREELLGKNDHDFFPQEQADYFTQNDRQVLDELGVIDIPEEPIDTKLLGRRFLHTKKISIRDEEGAPALLLGISEDVTAQREAAETLKEAHEQLERKVSERTRELREVNEELRLHAAEREEVTKFIRQSLREKELLLKEIHHRVKNNLQVISSLLKLQSRYLEDDHARHLFAQSEQRVRSMALIHERLYRSDGLAEIELSDYIKELAESLYRTYAIDPQRIRLLTDLDTVSLGIDQAIPCGLLLNEFFSNSLKHAFAPEQEGTLRVRLVDEVTHLRLSFSDDGSGLPADFVLEDQKTLGFKIIRTLADQLNATLTLCAKSPTQFTLHFPHSRGERQVRVSNANAASESVG